MKVRTDRDRWIDARQHAKQKANATLSKNGPDILAVEPVELCPFETMLRLLVQDCRTWQGSIEKRDVQKLYRTIDKAQDLLRRKGRASPLKRKR